MNIVDSLKKDPKKLFYIICIAGFVSYIVCNLVMGVEAMRWFVQENNPDIRFVDYFMHVQYARDPKNLYSLMVSDTQGCFPALSYILYCFLYRLAYVPGFSPSGREETEAMSGAYLVYIYYTLFVAFLLFVAIAKLNKNSKLGKNLLIFGCIMVSAPLMGSGFLVGNSTIFVLALLIMFVALNDSEKRICREVALILLAICAGFKIYPAVFGLLYLKEKRWKEAVKLTIYGILFFFVPFAFFGGVAGIKLWIGHIMGTMGMNEYGRVEYIKGVVYMMLVKLGMDETTGAFQVVCSLIPMMFLVIMIALAAISKNKYRTLLFLAAAITLYPTNAFRYTLSYFALPLVVWLQRETTEDKCIDVNIGVWGNVEGKSETWVRSILNGMIFAIPVLWGMLTGFKLNLGHSNYTYVELWIYVMAYLLLGYEMICQIKETTSHVIQ